LFITVILLLLVYVAPMQYLYTFNNLTLILIYASGGFILGGVTGIILTKKKKLNNIVKKKHNEVLSQKAE